MNDLERFVQSETKVRGLPDERGWSTDERGWSTDETPAQGTFEVPKGSGGWVGAGVLPPAGPHPVALESLAAVGNAIYVHCRWLPEQSDRRYLVVVPVRDANKVSQAGAAASLYELLETVFDRQGQWLASTQPLTDSLSVYVPSEPFVPEI